MRKKGCFISKRKKKAQVGMSLKIGILSKNAEVRRHLRRIVGLDPAWETVGGADFDKAIAGSPLKRPPDVVIAEMSQIDADMIPLIAAIRIKFGDSKILAVSDQRDSRLVLRIIHAGANGFMISDRASEELTAAINSVVAGEFYLSPGIAGLVGRRP
jgi:DNA-binding NarL/FixJ family response regulator